MNFWQRMNTAVNKGLATTQEIYAKTTEKAKKLGDEAVLKFHIVQLEKQTERRFAKLGSKVYELLVKEGKSTVSKSEADVKELLDEIRNLETEMEKLENDLQGLRKR